MFYAGLELLYTPTMYSFFFISLSELFLCTFASSESLGAFNCMLCARLDQEMLQMRVPRLPITRLHTPKLEPPTVDPGPRGMLGAVLENSQRKLVFLGTAPPSKAASGQGMKRKRLGPGLTRICASVCERVHVHLCGRAEAPGSLCCKWWLFGTARTRRKIQRVGRG